MPSNFPNGFVNGVLIKGIPLAVGYPGRIFWVDNSTGTKAAGVSTGANTGNSNGSFARPFSTLAYAVSQCVANRGDIIMLKPGHAESIASATALSMSVAGVAVIGVGTGSLRPAFTLGTATTATINITAANVSFFNCLFKANLADIVSLFTTTAAKSFTLDNCEFRDNSSILNFARIVDTNATSNDTDDLTITNCNFFGLGATANSCLIKMDGTNARLIVRNCFIAHAAVTDAGLMPIATGKVVTSAIIDNNIMSFVGATNATTGTVITTDGSTNSGMISRNLIQSLDATSEILVTASSGFLFSQNYSSAVADKSGYLLPAADS